MDPKGKVVVITGCDTGFGRMLAERLSGQGFSVVAGCLTTDGQRELLKLFTDQGTVAVFVSNGISLYNCQP